jgi:8-oxo-dGTP pyrophosphatase MutT (NUDIX family)
MARNIDVTVAAIIERDDRFLFVEELVGGARVFNQPAGHLEPGESLPHAVARETLEETGYRFEPTDVVGIYVWQSEEGTTFLRVVFCGVHEAPAQRPKLDEGIIDVHWLSRSQALARERELRSPLVLRCLDDYAAGARYPIEVLSHIESARNASGALARGVRR